MGEIKMVIWIMMTVIMMADAFCIMQAYLQSPLEICCLSISLWFWIHGECLYAEFK